MTAFAGDNDDKPQRLQKKSERQSFAFILEKIRDYIDAKDGVYKKDPMYKIDIEDALSQLKIKAIRAQLVVHKAKLEDELMDCVIYSILIMERLSKDERYFNEQ